MGFLTLDKINEIQNTRRNQEKKQDASYTDVPMFREVNHKKQGYSNIMIRYR